MDIELIALEQRELKIRLEAIEPRLERCENKTDEIAELAQATNKIAVNMEHMIAEQKRQSDRIDEIERKPLEDYTHYKRTVISLFLTGTISAIIGAIIGLIIR